MKRNREAGQALVAAALSLTVLLLAAGLAIDMGYLRYQERRMQAAADSAAIAGAAELAYGGSYAAAAQADSASNGFTHNVNSVTVTPNRPPSTGPFAGQPDYVEVLVQQIEPTFFMKIFRVNSVSISARSVAHLGSGRNCMYALSLNDPNALNLNDAAVSAPDCGIISNGNFTANGGSSVQALSIGVVGSSSTGVATVNPDPRTGIVPPSDPLLFLRQQQPVVGGCVPFPGAGTVVPGTYCGITMNVGAVIFSPGSYIVKGDFAISGSASVTGTGVTFFVTRDPTKPGSGSVVFNSSNTIDLVAPTGNTCAYSCEGILLFQDPADINAASLTANNQTLQGALYFPAAALTIGRNHNGAAYTIVVANQIVLQGGFGIFHMNNNFSSLSDGSPIKSAALVE
jgi:hypothetical protein